MVEVWSPPLHAIVILTAYGVSAVLHTYWPLALAVLGAFCALVASAAGRWTPSGHFGPANLLTALRLLIVLALAAALLGAPQGLLLAALVVAFLLDAVDGWVARRRGCASAFGATFDTETDAAFTLVVGLALWERNGVGPWVLVPGVVRYAYVLGLAIWPAPAGEPRGSRFGRASFLVSSLCLLAALAVAGDLGTLGAALGTMVTCVSFGISFAEAYPQLRRALRVDAGLPLRAWKALGPTLFFLIAWSFLNLMVNIRFPIPEPPGWYFLPSLDVTVLLAVFALLGLVGLRLSWALRAPLLALVVVVRILRVGDGITNQAFGQAFNVYADLPLAPELVRYAHSTFAAWQFYLGAVGALAGVALVFFAIDRALVYSAAFLRRRWNILIFVGLALPFVIASQSIDHDPRYNQRYAGAFGASVVPRIGHEANFLLNIYDHRASEARAIAATQERLQKTPANLSLLHHANLYLIFVESYGATVFDRPYYAERALPALKTMESDLARHGFSSASGLLVSATYGGMSWLAHATMLTGVRTTNQLQFDLLGVSRPRSMARLVHEAGYHTVLVQPNTNRKGRGADFYDFDSKYENWDFDYAGPPFAWATMPDQYVLDFIRRRAIVPHAGPLFVTYVLVSSHAPWSLIPTMVPDWAQVGNGAIYANYPLHRAETNWPNFSNASEPYVKSIVYDIDVLRSYLTEFVKDNSLIIILGDHQPVSELTENSPSFAVPIHVISRDSSAIAPFLQRGYASGMVPGQTTSPMESFLVDFLRDFSGGAS